MTFCYFFMLGIRKLSVVLALETSIINYQVRGHGDRLQSLGMEEYPRDVLSAVLARSTTDREHVIMLARSSVVEEPPRQAITLVVVVLTIIAVSAIK